MARDYTKLLILRFYRYREVFQMQLQIYLQLVYIFYKSKQ